MLGMVQIMYLDFCLKPDVNVQYAAFGYNLIFDRIFNSFTSSFTLMITYSFMYSFVPTITLGCLLTSLVIFNFMFLKISFCVFEYTFAVSYFSGCDFFAFGKYPILGPNVFNLFYQVSIFFRFPTQVILSA